MEHELNLKNVRFLNELFELGIPKDLTFLAGSAVLTLYGVRPNSDLDVTIPKVIFETMKERPHVKFSFTANGEEMLSYKNVDLHWKNWPFENIDPNQNILYELDNALVYGGYSFFTLERLKEWKTIVGRDKDLKDIETINELLGVK